MKKFYSAQLTRAATGGAVRDTWILLGIEPKPLCFQDSRATRYIMEGHRWLGLNQRPLGGQLDALIHRFPKTGSRPSAFVVIVHLIYQTTQANL